MPEPYPTGSVLDLLARYGGFLLRRSDFPEADRSRGGHRGWCPVQLGILVLLQQHHGWTDRETVRRASMDLQVKACLGLGIEQQGPNQSTLCRHRQWMQRLELDVLCAERMRDLLEALELVGDTEPVLVDSVPIDGAGQQLDTYNLLAGAVRHGLRELARMRSRPVEQVAADLELTPYLHRSIKGCFGVQWDNEASRMAFLARLVADARLIRQQLLAESKDKNSADDKGGHDESSGRDEMSEGEDELSPALQDAIDTIDDIITHDIELDEHQRVLGIRQQAAQDRRISLTDPNMRHGRKSASKLISGYKAQVVASLNHGFIVTLRVFGANRPDGEELPQIARELADNGIEPAWWAGDHAYGTLANHRYFKQSACGELIARMARPLNGGRWTKDAFQYDFDTHTLTCPAGHQTSQSRWAKQNHRKGRLFAFPAKHCRRCPQQESCISPQASPQRGRSVFTDPRPLGASSRSRVLPAPSAPSDRRAGYCRLCPMRWQASSALWHQECELRRRPLGSRLQPAHPGRSPPPNSRPR
ncbi:MAG: transposase [Myxococcota bacterium]